MNKRISIAVQLKKQSWLEYDVARRKLARTKESLVSIQENQLLLLKERTFTAEEIRKVVDSEVDRYVRKKNIDVKERAYLSQLKTRAL
jgi:hypothetical protein